MVLNKNLPSPFLPENDEEKIEGDKPTPKIDKKDTGFTIDFANIDQRILAFPLPSGNYAGLSAGPAGSVYFLSRSEPGEGRGAGPAGATLNRYDIERRRASTVQAGVTAYELTPDGRKLLYSTGSGNWFVTTAGSGGGGGGLPVGPRSGLPTAPAPERAAATAKSTSTRSKYVSNRAPSGSKSLKKRGA